MPTLEERMDDARAVMDAVRTESECMLGVDAPFTAPEPAWCGGGAGGRVGSTRGFGGSVSALGCAQTERNADEGVLQLPGLEV
jgi:hypothetical protein